MQTLRRFFTEFCANSNIHGVRYFTERMLHWTERLWWIIAFGVSLWLCGSMIHDVRMYWNEYPIEFLNEKSHISTIPFPSVTICPQIKNLKHKLDISSKFNKKLKTFVNLSDIDQSQLNALAHVCPYFRSTIKIKDDFSNDNIYKIIEDVAPNLEYLIQECRWQQMKINCSEYITPTMTRQGVCFTFNAFNSNDMFTDEVETRTIIAKTNRNVSDWSMESDYKTEFIKNEYPIRVLDSGRRGSLELILSSNTQDHDFMCKGHLQGFLLLISTPGDSLELQSYSPAEFFENILIKVNPKMMTTSKELRTYNPMQRGCFFSFERQLHFFKMYTEHNCNVECLANLTKQRCGCVRFSIPKDTTTKICGVAKIKCYEEVKNSFAIKHELLAKKCHCLPSCRYIGYEAKLDRVKLSMDSVRKFHFDPNKQQTRMTIFFEDDNIEMEIRVEKYTITDFLAICGGLLGLFLGISALSIIELIYFWTLRLFWIVYWSRFNAEAISDRRKINPMYFNENAWIDQNRWKIFRYIAVVWKFFSEFSNNTNIHGFCYFNKQKLHWSERLWWLFAFGVSLWLCGSMINNVWIQWIEDPVIMSSNSSRNLSSSLPTVTICPEIKTMKHKLDITAAIDSLSNLSDIEMTRLNALAHICPLLSHSITYKDNFANESIYDTIQDIAPSIRESMIACVWQNAIKYCSKLFTPVLTDEGLCFTFNALNSHEIHTNEMAPGMMIVKDNLNASGWSLDSGYANVNAEENYPFEAYREGHIIFLISILAINSRDIEYQCKGCDSGFKLILTMPGEMVQPSQNYLRLSILNQNLVEIRSKLTITSDGLRSYKSNQRQCYYNSDHPLRFFKIYTKSNCEAECLANFTKIECGCVKFSMPRDNNTKICGGANIKCYKLARWNLFTSKRGKIFHEKCNCLPSCTFIEYTTKTQRTTFNQTKINQISDRGIPNNQHRSIFALTFNGNSKEIMTRKVMYTLSDFLAVCGGLLGLFLGVSFLSIIELIYYSTLRLYWTIKMKRNNS